ncbi:MAG: ABC transporter transmembrane domain-containing protein, partial [Thermomicrobiales bacterium]
MSTATRNPAQNPASRANLSLDDRENDLGRKLNRESALRLLAYIKPYWGQAALALFAIVVQTVGELALPRLLGVAIDAVRDGALGAPGGGRKLAITVIIFIACVLIVFVARWTQGYLTTRVGTRVILDLRCALFDHLQVLGMKTFDRMGVGRLISRVQSDVSVLQDLITSGIIGLFADLLVL